MDSSDDLRYCFPADGSGGPSDQLSSYVWYGEAIAHLGSRLSATPAEIAAWIFLGTDGGFEAYLDPQDYGCPPPRFRFDGNEDWDNYLTLLDGCWFHKSDIANFEPHERFLTWGQLLDRWADRTERVVKQLVFGAIRQGILYSLHPINGVCEQLPNDPMAPPIEQGLFPLSQIKSIEKGGETPKERFRRLKSVHELEMKLKPRGALQRTANQEGISRQRLKQILDGGTES